MPSRQVDQFAMELGGGEGHDRPWRIALHCGQGPVQPHGGILEDVVGVFPAADAGEAAKHPVGKGVEAAGDEFDNSIPRREVAVGQLLHGRC
jgi:hypothetical protein